jgi:hypothetical protein
VKKVFILAILFINLLDASYILKKSVRYKSRLNNIYKHSFADMKNIPQDVSFYAKQITPIPYFRQLQYDKRYNYRYFYPWSIKSAKNLSLDFGWEVKMAIRRHLYMESGKEYLAITKKRWIDNANMKALGSANLYAITTKHTNLRALPTYSSFYLAKKGKYLFDFNYNQNSAIYPNTPLYITHYSKDKKWAYVVAPYSFGWVNLSTIAVVNKGFIKEFKSGNYGVVVKDNCRIYKDGRSYTLVKLGTIFPIRDGKYLLAVKAKDSHAKIVAIKVAQNNIVAKKPFAFNSANVAKVAKEFVGEPYGWGGGFYCRDCSATTRDFFGVFGIFLSRNSSKQAKEGARIKIPKASYNFRKRFIIDNAKPFRSLMYVPGHIVLYLGTFKGEPVIMHTYWGVRKKDGSKIITARTIITTLEAGKERSDTRVKSRLIYTLKDIINF